MDNLAEEFRDVLNLYVKLTADLTRLTDTDSVSEEDQQALVQLILDNRSCLTEIQQLNKRLTRLYGIWQDKKENPSDLSGDDEIIGVVVDVREQMRQLEALCGSGVQKVEAWRKQLSEGLANVGKNSRYLQMLKPLQENYPKFIDSDC